MQAIQDNVLDLIAELPHDWHRAGSLSMNVLAAMVRLTGGRVARSVETGAGKSTSFGHELAQMALLDRTNVKVVPSHVSATVGRL